MPRFVHGGTQAVPSSTPTSPLPATTDTNAAPGASELSPKALQQLLTKANKGDTQAFETVCTRFPATAWLWEVAGNIGAQVQESLLMAYLGKDALFSHEAQRRACAALRRDLEGPTPSPLERVLVDRVVLCWLHLHLGEGQYAQNMQHYSLRQHDVYQRRLSMAQRRYLAAITALAQVRRLQVPHVQVNIAREQLNVAALAPAHPHQHHAERTAR